MKKRSHLQTRIEPQGDLVENSIRMWQNIHRSTATQMKKKSHFDKLQRCIQVTWFKDSGKIFETDRALMTVKGST